MAAKKDNRLAWGVTLLVFGCLFLLKQLAVFSPETSELIFDFKNFPFIMGVIFLLTHSNKSIAIVLIVVGLLFRLSMIIELTKHVSDYIWPVLLIIAGAIMIFGLKRK